MYSTVVFNFCEIDVQLSCVSLIINTFITFTVLHVDDLSVVLTVHQWLKQNGKELSSNNAFAHLLLNYAALLER